MRDLLVTKMDGYGKWGKFKNNVVDKRNCITGICKTLKISRATLYRSIKVKYAHREGDCA